MEHGAWASLSCLAPSTLALPYLLGMLLDLATLYLWRALITIRDKFSIIENVLLVGLLPFMSSKTKV